MQNNKEGILTLGSLFDGSGGFPLAGILSGIRPIWASEIEPFPIRVTRKNLPFVKHYGDIQKMNGRDIEPVDIITFGSPCQDLSIAGKRAGLNDGERSSLFFEAIRIIKEMRERTDEEKPKYIVWENVAGAYSSNKGEDFRCVLESICNVVDEKVSVPKPEEGKWRGSGEIVGDKFSVAWRTIDAQYWGVPQRRKRIYLVADFTGQRAGKILFESEGLSGYSAEGFKTWKRIATNSKGSTGTAGKCLNPRDVICKTANPTFLFENHPQDGRCNGPLDVAPTVANQFGTCGNNVPLWLQEGTWTFDVRFTSEGTQNARGHCYETNVSRCLDTAETNPDSNHGGIVVLNDQGGSVINTSEDVVGTLRAQEHGHQPCVCFEPGIMSREGGHVYEDVAGTLRAKPGDNQQTVCYGISRADYNMGENAKFGLGITDDGTEPMLVAKGAGAVCYPINTMVATRTTDEKRTTFGIGEDGEPQFTLGANHEHAVCVQGSMIGRDDKNGPQGSGVNEDVAFTLNATDRHAVAFAEVHAPLNAQDGREAVHSQMLAAPEENFVMSIGNGQGNQTVSEDVVSTLDASHEQMKILTYQKTTGTLCECIAKGTGNQIANDDMLVANQYVVRRLTPTECARLQGFPDWWCEGLVIESPTDDEIDFWDKVFEEYSSVVTHSKSKKTRNQIVKWLNSPHADSSEYKMWGNGIALPCAWFVLAGIAWADSQNFEDSGNEQE